MAEKKETAEQKLLKMIEASSGAGPTKALAKTGKKRNVYAAISAANKVLIIGIILTFIVMGYEFQAGIRNLNQGLDAAATQIAQKKGMSVENLLPTVQRLSFYLASVNRRNIFVPYEEKATATTGVDASNTAIARATKNFRLVGISWMDRVDTASVMIEDTDQKVTYFLHQGEKVKLKDGGDIVVKTIYADSVELGFQNEEIIIRYDKPKN